MMLISIICARLAERVDRFPNNQYNGTRVLTSPNSFFTFADVIRNAVFTTLRTWFPSLTTTPKSLSRSRTRDGSATSE